MTPKSRGNLLVLAQFALLGILMITPPAWKPGPGAEVVVNSLYGVGWVVLSISLGTLGRSLTANPVPLENAKLKTTGIYRLVRHPIYLGLILIGAGLTLHAGSLIGVIAFALLVVLLNCKARFEERMLLAKFPEYAEYAARVGRLFPGVGRIRNQ